MRFAKAPRNTKGSQSNSFAFVLASSHDSVAIFCVLPSRLASLRETLRFVVILESPSHGPDNGIEHPPGVPGIRREGRDQTVGSTGRGRTGRRRPLHGRRNVHHEPDRRGPGSLGPVPGSLRVHPRHRHQRRQRQRGDRGARSIQCPAHRGTGSGAAGMRGEADSCRLDRRHRSSTADGQAGRRNRERPQGRDGSRRGLPRRFARHHDNRHPTQGALRPEKDRRRDDHAARTGKRGRDDRPEHGHHARVPADRCPAHPAIRAEDPLPRGGRLLQLHLG